ncbi:MAG: hypothetical protein FGM15_06285 [Chthoniobacterales bacterium]|nr:hypothetical protein [Chthoniobacterales bacterium]
MKALLPVVLAAGITGCANQDPYQDPDYVLQRNLYHRNQKWDSYQNRQYMRRQAQDDRYESWFNAVME